MTDGTPIQANFYRRQSSHERRRLQNLAKNNKALPAKINLRSILVIG